jgi:hypothetical protein
MPSRRLAGKVPWLYVVTDPKMQKFTANGRKGYIPLMLEDAVLQYVSVC